jgi:uncharacterized protein YgfB (UPF0149 family)
MNSDVDYDTLNDALHRCGATWDAAQAHGLLSSRLAVASAAAGPDWLQQVLEGTNESDALRTECAGSAERPVPGYPPAIVRAVVGVRAAAARR